MELLEKGINLEFINEPHINTDYYKKMQAQTVAIAKSGRESVEMKNRIIKMSKCFSGNMSDKECMEILQIARNTFYKYKREPWQKQKMPGAQWNKAVKLKSDEGAYPVIRFFASG